MNTWKCFKHANIIFNIVVWNTTSNSLENYKKNKRERVGRSNWKLHVFDWSVRQCHRRWKDIGRSLQNTCSYTWPSLWYASSIYLGERERGPLEQWNSILFPWNKSPRGSSHHDWAITVIWSLSILELWLFYVFNYVFVFYVLNMQQRCILLEIRHCWCFFLDFTWILCEKLLAF